MHIIISCVQVDEVQMYYIVIVWYQCWYSICSFKRGINSVLFAFCRLNVHVNVYIFVCFCLLVCRFAELPDEWSPPVKTEFVEIVRHISYESSGLFLIIISRVTFVLGCSMRIAMTNSLLFIMVGGLLLRWQRFATTPLPEKLKYLSERFA